jgi:hypothetical protein
MPDDVNWDNVQWDEPAKYNPAEGIPTSAFAYSVTYFADKLLVSLKEIIRGSGLSPERLTDQWKTLHQGLRTWLAARSRHRCSCRPLGLRHLLWQHRRGRDVG